MYFIFTDWLISALWTLNDALANLGGPIRIAGLRENAKPSRGMKIRKSILLLLFSSWTIAAA